ncbi:MAG: DUF503 domain-containing protein [Acidimicrobiia bacterium]|nr:DUF503 domain-containing protein [Acidimicrobiia bacterium]
MRVAALRVEIHLPSPQSLKEKRAILRPVVERLRRLGSYSIAEVDHHDDWQRATIGIAVVAGDGTGLEAHISRIRNYLDSRLELEVLDVFRSELENPG